MSDSVQDAPQSGEESEHEDSKQSIGIEPSADGDGDPKSNLPGVLLGSGKSIDDFAQNVLSSSENILETETSNVDTSADFDADEEEGDNGDDVVNVIIKPSSKAGIYKTGAAYQARSIAHSSQHTKATRQGVELDDPGDIQGVPTIEFNLSSLGEDDKPWKRPGADITDYFNYGFTEETWVQYCEKQKILRQEYANATLKPVLASGGTGLLQRLRTGGSNVSRSFDNFKQTNINVINLSHNAMNGHGLLNQKGTEAASVLLNGVAANPASILASFTQPPPGYPAATVQSDGSFAATGFQALGAGTAASQLLAASNAAGAAGIFPNMSLPPPILGALSTWPAPVGVHGLLSTADAMIDPTTGQVSTLLDHQGRSPGSVYSNEDHGSRRTGRHYHGDEGDYFERDSYRSRRRSRSSSRDRDRHHSRHRRHRESGRSDRDHDRRSSRRLHRSRDRFSRDERFSSGPPDDFVEAEDFPAPTSAILHADRRSDRDRPSRDRSRDRSERVAGRDKANHRSHRRERERSVRSSRRSRHRSGSRGSHRREAESPTKSPLMAAEAQSHDDPPKPTDPLVAAAAAAANIAIALGASGKT